MAQTAAAVAVSPPLGALPSPTLIDVILTEHSCTLTLFNYFFKARGHPQAAHWRRLVPMHLQPSGFPALLSAGAQLTWVWLRLGASCMHPPPAPGRSC
jgi:hypothetical protein